MIYEMWDDQEFLRELEARDGNAAALARACGVPVGRIKRRRTKLARQTDKTIRVLFFSDIHFPHQEEHAVERLLDHMASERWDHVIDGGDRVDAYSVSKYDKDPRRITSLPDELRMSEHFSLLVEQATGARLHFCRGNHEQRIPDYLRRKAPALEGLDQLSLTNLLGLQGWHVHDRPGVVIGGVRFKHGDKVAKGAGNSVRKEMDDLWQSVVMGHCHRQAVVRTRKHQEFVGVEAGCLARMDPEYCSHPDWKQGWVSLTITGDGVDVEEHTPE